MRTIDLDLVNGRPQRGAVTWLVLVYKVPAAPSRLRAGVRRRLKALGAVYLQHGVAALPHSPAAERALRNLCREIRVSDGIAELLHCRTLAGQSDVAAIYSHARDDEYRDLIGHCQDFAGHVERLIVEQRHSYEELKKRAESLAKLRGVGEEIHARDVLGAQGRDEATSALIRCEEILQAWSDVMYQAEPW
jgi:DNA-binding transcriptional regulator PaaX